MAALEAALSPPETVHIGFLLYPGCTQLDITGPIQVLSLIPFVKIHMLWKNKESIMTDSGFSINPTTSFAECPQLTVLATGGSGTIGDMLIDEEVIAFMQRQAVGAKYICSVCNGSLILGAAGLLKGYKSCCHWLDLDNLARFGAIPVKERVVKDRNRISGGGVTAGIDFGLTLAAEIVGEDTAKVFQLVLEYNPSPPYDTGTPEKAGPALVGMVMKMQEQPIARTEVCIKQALETLNGKN
jgi:cyclohexyl-isocyanide hydratase